MIFRLPSAAVVYKNAAISKETKGQDSRWIGAMPPRNGSQLKQSPLPSQSIANVLNTGSQAIL